MGNGNGGLRWRWDTLGHLAGWAGAGNPIVLDSAPTVVTFAIELLAFHTFYTICTVLLCYTVLQLHY